MEKKGEGQGQPTSREERLAAYGLNAKEVEPQNVHVGEREYVRLSLRDPTSRFAGTAHRIPIRSIQELKHLIGVPDAVARRECGRRYESPGDVVAPEFESLGQLTTRHQDALRLAAKEFLHGNSETVAHYAPALDKALQLAKRANITIIALNDIIVEAFAVLELDGTVDVIVANKVLIKRGGQIRVRGPVKIDCDNLQGEENPFTISTVIQGFAQGLGSMP